nr:hypothetical protein [Cellulomonas sp. HLT2-17]
MLAIVAGAWVTYQRNPARAATLLAQMTAAVETAADTRAPLPAAADRDYPAPGYEEEPGPLGVAPTVTSPSAQYMFGRTQTNAAGQTVPVAWSPCRPVHVVIDLAGAPAGFQDDVHLVIGELSAATGLVFADDGVTTETPDIEAPAPPTSRSCATSGPTLSASDTGPARPASDAGPRRSLRQAGPVPIGSSRATGIVRPARRANFATSGAATSTTSFHIASRSAPISSCGRARSRRARSWTSAT